MKTSVAVLKLWSSLAALLLIGIDQLLKLWIAGTMQLFESIPVIPGVLHITYVLNDGAAFSFMAGQSWLLCGVTSLLMVVLTWLFYSRFVRQPLCIYGIALILSGGIGNLIDRVFRGERLFHGRVVDYVDFRLINFAVFNFADCCVVVGTGLIMLYLILSDKKKKQNAPPCEDACHE